MSYVRFGLLILTSTAAMFILMYSNTYALEHLFYSETRAYMAIVMGATMAVIMLAFMLGMYSNKALNIAIFAGSVVVFAGALWLVRSQITVSGPSYMRAMIPHHSIAILTSERAQIDDARVRKLADEIIEAQNREIAEMRYLIADISSGNLVQDIYEDPPASLGTVADALNNTQIATLDLAPMPRDEADQVLEAQARCTFRRTDTADPVLWAAQDGTGGAMKLNGVIVPLEKQGEADAGATVYSARGITLRLRSLGDDADWRQDSELVFALDEGPTVGYRGFYSCGG